MMCAASSTLSRSTTRSAAPQPQGTDGFVTKFNRNGAIVYSTYFGGSSSDGGTAIAVDAAGADAVGR